MPHVLGKFLPENRPVRDALTQFVGIGDHTAYRICARLQFHETLKMGEMSERQLNALSHEVGDLKLEILDAAGAEKIRSTGPSST